MVSGSLKFTLRAASTCARNRLARCIPLGKVSHCGSFPELESQLCQYTTHGYAGAGSPDRAEALVWAFTELFPHLTPTALAVKKDGFTPGWSYYRSPDRNSWIA